MLKRTRIALITGIAAVALTAGGVAFAASQSGPTPAAFTAAVTSAPSASPAAGARKHAAHGWLARLEHGEFTVRTKKGDQVIDIQRGQVTAVSATSVTVKSADGFTATYTVNGDTKVRKDKHLVAIGDVHTGDKVGVLAVNSGGDTAKRITDGTA